MDIELKKKWAKNWFIILQEMICKEIEQLDGKAKFKSNIDDNEDHEDVL